MDEIQNVKPKHEQFINELHEGNHVLPIVPLYTGLANSRKALAGIGVSRVQTDNVRTFSSLSVAESKRNVKLLIVRCRITHSRERFDEISNGIAERSEGWPQHLRTETAALSWRLKQADCELSRTDFAEIDSKAQYYRVKSYRARRSPEIDAARNFVGAMMRDVPEQELPRGKITNAISRNARPVGTVE